MPTFPDDLVECVAKALFEADEDLIDRQNDPPEVKELLGPRTTWDTPCNAPIQDAFRERARYALRATVTWNNKRAGIGRRQEG